MVTVLPAPWLPGVTKSAFGASATLRFTVRFAAGAGTALTVKLAPAPSVTGDVPGTIVTTGKTVVSVTVIRPSSVRVPAAPPPRPVAVNVPRLTVNVSSLSSLSAPADSAISARVGDPPELPITVTVLPVRPIPAGAPDSVSA